MNRKLFTALAVLVALHPPLLPAGNLPQSAVPPVAATQPADPSTQGSDTSLSPTRDTAWLGVSLSNVPDVLFTQLAQVIPPGQGVLVEGVIPDSPAARAGIHTNDILLAYDDQKLFSARQLAGLLHADQPDRNVAIQAIQQGQLKTLNVTLGKQTLSASLPARHHHPFRRRMPMMHHRYMPNWPPFTPSMGKAGRQPAWNQFESVEVHTLPDGRYHAEVGYTDKGNESRQFSFEGTQEEIRDQIQKNTTMPDDKKQALLQALNLNPEAAFSMPMFGDNPFNDPFFQANPFDDDLFMGFPPMRMPPGFPSNFQPAAPAHHGAGKGGSIL